MNYEQIDQARVDEAFRVIKDDARKNLLLEVARLAREGWTPPVPVDPDLVEAKKLVDYWSNISGPFIDLALAGIKRGRALAAAEAKPGMVWVKHDGKDQWPFWSDQRVFVKYTSGAFVADKLANICWPTVTHYAIITQPEEK